MPLQTTQRLLIRTARGPLHAFMQPIGNSRSLAETHILVLTSACVQYPIGTVFLRRSGYPPWAASEGGLYDALRSELHIAFSAGRIGSVSHWLEPLKSRNDPDALIRHGGPRTEELFETIRVHTDACRKLLDHLGSQSSKARMVSPLFQDFRLPSEKLKSGLLRTIREHSLCFAQICALPFRRVAAEVLKDLGILRSSLESTSACSVDGCADIRNIVIRLRQRLTWMLARDALELQIRTPVSLLLEELRPAVQKVGGTDRSRVVVNHSVAPSAFNVIAERIDRFRGQIGRCSDSFLGGAFAASVRERIDRLPDPGATNLVTVKSELAEIANLL